MSFLQHYCMSGNGVIYLQGKPTHHSALLVWEVDTDGAASLGVGHFAVV